MVAKIHFVSAGAGSGKTHRLTEILHEKLAGGSVSPAGVIATTFTRKAAAELRERVRSALLAKGEFGRANAMGQAYIGTVNSVCGALIERFAFEVGLAPEQRVLDEGQAKALVTEAMDEVVEESTLTDLVAVAGRLGIEDWREPLKTLIDQARANDIAAETMPGFAAENADTLFAHFPKVTKDALDKGLIGAIDAALPELQQGADAGRKNTGAYLELARDVRQRLAEGSARWSEWPKLEKAAPEKALMPLAERIAAFAGRYGEHPRLREDITKYLDILFGLSARTFDIYAKRKRDLGVIDFADQEHLFLKALDIDEVAQTMREELQLLLVDEFQDTSPIQLALFLKLAEFAKESYWVGDVKQAIYGFRGSDTALMKAILAALPGLGGETEILGSSHRSRPPLVRLVNAVFSKAFEGELKPEEVELKPVRKELVKGAAFANWQLNGKNKDQEYAALAAGIRDLVDSGFEVVDPRTAQARPVRFGDIAVLAKMNDGVAKAAAVLRDQDIPWATQQPGLLQTPEGALALACLRRLNDPGDTIASAEIVSLCDSTEPETWLADRLKYLASEAPADKWREEGENVHPVLARVADLRTSLSVLSPSEALAMVITRCDLAAIVLRWRRDELVARVRLANLEAVLKLARSYEDACRATDESATVSGLILWFAEQAEGGTDMLAEPGVDAVKILTHHGAKGLEWPVVILLDLASDVRDRLWSVRTTSKGKFRATEPLKNRMIRYWPWPFGMQKKVGLADQMAQSPEGQAAREDAVLEAKRLLYVSMTRARDLLVFARSSRKLTGEWLETVNAPWLWPEKVADTLPLPKGGVAPYAFKVFDPPDVAPKARDRHAPLYWFKTPTKLTAKLPLVVLPSGAVEQPCKIAEKVQIGKRIALKPHADMTMIGTALHACIAAAVTARSGAPVAEDDVRRVLVGFGVAQWLGAADVAKQIDAILSWIAERWPGGKLIAEVPVESLLPDGQVLTGQIDLLIETKAGWIILDHKANPQGANHWDKLAKSYSGQLAAYAGAVTKATGSPVKECWLVLPVAGGAVRLGA